MVYYIRNTVIDGILKQFKIMYRNDFLILQGMR